MDARLATVKCLIKILEQNKTSDEVINSYAGKVNSMPELINLVAGTVKFKLALDFFMEKISSRPLNKLSPPIKNILRAALYEIEYLKKPEYAVINSYVEITKTYEKNSSGFVNAVLRNFLRQRNNIEFPAIDENPAKSISIKHSHPEWLVEKWIKAYGIEETIKICEFNNTPPKISVRINSLKTSKQEVMNLFAEKNIEFEKSKICGECLILKNTGNIKDLIGYKEGFWAVQGEASSLVAKILEPEKGERILDLCAAPGGKTTHMAALMQDSGEIIAVDINAHRIKKIEENCKRMGITSVKTIAADAAIFPDKSQSNDYSNFDRILIDAPCSNTGVFSKRPDARWKRTPQDIKSLTEIQYKILNNAARLLKEGGILVYSTCSIESEENILLIQKFLDNNRDFQFESISRYLPWQDKTEGGFVQIFQSKHNIDGFFIAKLKKIIK